MARIDKPFEQTLGKVPTPAEWSSIFDRIYNEINGNLDAENVDNSVIAVLSNANTWTAEQTFNGGVSFGQNLDFSAITLETDDAAAGEVKSQLTLEWDPDDGSNMTDGSSGVGIDMTLPNSADDQTVFGRVQTIVEDDTDGTEDSSVRIRGQIDGSEVELFKFDGTVRAVWSGSQTDYDGLTPDDNTLYLITS